MYKYIQIKYSLWRFMLRKVTRFSNLEFQRKINGYKHRSILDFLENKLDIPKNSYDFAKSEEKSNYIWTMWWQGEDNAPKLVKECINRMRTLNDKKTLVVIDKDNYREYCKLSGNIEQKLENGVITLTHFSDIMRFNLLKRFGGVWIDSTVLLTQKIPNEVFNKRYYSIKNVPENFENVVDNRWAGNFVAGSKNFPLFAYFNDFFEEYWSKFDYLIDFFLIDYAFIIAYEKNIGGIKNVVDNLPYNNPDYNWLANHLEDSWTQEFQTRISNNKTFAYKLTRRKNINFDDKSNVFNNII